MAKTEGAVFIRKKAVFLMGIAVLSSLLLMGCERKKEKISEPEKERESTSLAMGQESFSTSVQETETQVSAPTSEPLVPENLDPQIEDDVLPEGMVWSYLSGKAVPEVQGRRRPAAVMLSNIISACPQTGISRADVIYEAPVEGGITRLMGIFENYDDLDKIGSVRSCREYYVYLAAGFDALYYHYGQAAYAIPLLESDHIDNINGMEYSDEVYYRTMDRQAPHNAYLSAEGIARGIDLCGYRTTYRDDYHGFFQFASEENSEMPKNGKPAKYVEPGGYFHNHPWFSYDPDSGNYLRYQFGEPQIDDMTGEQLTVKNIIVQYCSWEKYDEQAEYLNIDVVNGGSGWYITNGKAAAITWGKEDPWGVTRYYDADKKEIRLNQGKTWILIVLDQYEDETKIQS